MINNRIASSIPALTLLICLAGCMSARAQQFEWKTGFFGFFDNREYFNEYIIPQTMGGENLSAEAGFAVDPHNRFRAGISYTYENGSKGESLLPDVILYYKGEWKPATFYIGSFPRYQLISHPMAMLTDTLIYYRPMVEGMFLEHRRDWGYQNIWLDWTSRQTDTRRETFLLGASGLFHKGVFLYRHHFLMYHFAGPGVSIPDDHIRDNGGINVMAGLDLSEKTFFDTASFTTGFLMSYDQKRHVYDMRFMWGWLSDLDVNYKGFGLHGIYYRGEGQVFLYGDGFYKSGNYGRADFYFQKSWLDRISGKLEFSLHFLPGHLDYAYAVYIRATMDGKVHLGRSKQ
jgi:hypothetical protein